MGILCWSWYSVWQAPKYKNIWGLQIEHKAFLRIAFKLIPLNIPLNFVTSMVKIFLHFLTSLLMSIFLTWLPYSNFILTAQHLFPLAPLPIPEYLPNATTCNALKMSWLLWVLLGHFQKWALLIAPKTWLIFKVQLKFSLLQEGSITDVIRSSV